MPLPPRGVYRLRENRVSVAGAIYFITKNAEQRLAPEDPPAAGPLTADGAADTIVAQLRWVHRTKRAQIVSFVVMPDHIHMLCVLGESHSLDQVMHGLCSYTAHAIATTQDQPGQLWQRGFYEHAVQPDEDLNPFYRYIMYNPVTAGYVEEPSAWQWVYPKEL